MSEAAALQSQTTKAVPSNSNSLLVQRKCACGGSSGLTGSCSGCEKKKLLGQPLQTKLRINEPGDAYEQEADRVAEQVMRMADASVNPEAPPMRAAPLVQRRAAGTSGAGIVAAPPVVQDVLASPGQPLDAETRDFFEPRFGHDFGHVRVHSDAKAAESARAVNAMAYTAASHIVFEQYAPRTTGGNSLLAHELTHVVQQAASSLDVSERIYPSCAMRTGKGMRLIDPSAQPKVGPTRFLQRKLLVNSPAEPIPNPTGDGVVQTNADSVLQFIQQLCAEGSTTVKDGEVKNSYCDSYLAWPYLSLETPTSCRCVCELIDSKHVWEIKVDDRQGPETEPTSQQDVFSKHEPIGPTQPGVETKSSGRGSGGVVRIPSPNSPRAWGTSKESGQLEITQSWLLLGHELCGHAWLMSKGEASEEDEASRGKGGHKEAIAIENKLREEHSLEPRSTFLGPFCGESFSVPREKVQAGQDLPSLRNLEGSRDPETQKPYVDLCYDWRVSSGKCDKSEPKKDCLSKTVKM